MRATLALAVCALGAACAQARSSSPSSSGVASDSQTHTAMAQLLREGLSGRVLIDPRPIPPDLDGFGRDVVPSKEGVNSEPGLRRLDELQRIGMRMAGDPIRAGCGGALEPYQPETIHRACPAEAVIMFVIGRARAHGAVIDSLQSVGKASGRQLRTVGVIQSVLTPHGSMTTVLEYTIGLDANHWVIVARRPLLIIE